MKAPLWIIPIQPQRAQYRATLGVLRSQELEFTTVSPARVRELLDESPPRAAVVHGGPMSPLLFEVQRWLWEFRVPALILVEGLVDYYEATLLDRGARDVLSLPVSSQKLSSWLETLAPAQRYRGPDRCRSDQARGRFEVDPSRRAVVVDQQTIRLTKSEFELVLALSERRGEVVTRDEMTRRVGDGGITGRALESHMSRLRRKLQQAAAADLVQTVRGVGYRLIEPPTAADIAP